MKEFKSIYIDNLEEFINENLIERPSSIFLEMEKFGLENRIPILSPGAGSVLKFLIETNRPSKVLELGTGLGYSTAWMLASGLPLEITTIDRNDRELNSAKSFLDRILLPEQNVNYIHRWCVEYLKEIPDINDFSLIFIDCDKVAYPEILEYLIAEKKPGLKIIFDNVLWHGRLDEVLHTKPSDRAVQDFWKIIKSSSWKTKVLFPAGDGLILLE